MSHLTLLRMRRLILSAVVLFGLASQSFAQAPGGVKSPEMWFGTFPNSYNPQGYYYWKDLSGDSIRNLVYDARGAGYGTEFTQSRSSFITLNFNPTLNLSSQNTPKVALLRYSNLAQATILGVFMPRPSNISTDAMLYTIDGREGEGSLMSKDKALRTGNSYIDYGKDKGEDLLYSSQDKKDEQTFRTTSPRILAYLKADRPLHSVWGEGTRSVITTGYAYNSANVNNTTDYNTSLFGNAAFDGYTPELIAYGRMLSPLERKKVESYLAIKYGITLEGSYFDSGGNLIWDRDASTVYHHRVTGIARSDASQLMQPLSTTSYEEGPNYSNDPPNDTYYNSNTLNLPTNKRLLVMGRENASPMTDGDFMLWGDDNSPTTTYVYEPDTLWHVMHRSWELRTNIDSLANDNPVWTAGNLTIEKDTINPFISRLYQTSTSSNSYAVTRVSDGNRSTIEFTMPASYPTFDVGFNVNGDGTCQYGYRFSAGKVSVINNGTAGSYILSTAQGNRIEVIRQKDYVSLRIAGIGSEQALISTSGKALSHGVVAVKTADVKLDLADLRQGGFGDTGNQIELNYNLVKDEDFSEYRKGRTLLLINRSGSGDVTPETAEAIPAAGYDEARGKVLFRNIFFDTDKNGIDRFTFAYYEGLLAALTPIPSTCIAGKPQADGKIKVNVKVGTPSFSYTLTVDTVAGAQRGAVARQGTSASTRFEIAGLLPGTYTLDLRQAGGAGLSANVSSGQAAYAYSTRLYSDPELTWKVADNSSFYSMGLVNTDFFITNVIHGFTVRNDVLVLISNGNRTVTNIKVAPGDVLSVKLTGWTLQYIHNGTVLRTTSVSPNNWSVGAVFGTGVSKIDDISANGSLPDFDRHTSNITFASSPSGGITRTVMIGSECDASLPNGVVVETRATEAKRMVTTDINTTTGDAKFKVANKPGTLQYDATLALTKDARATLLVFDASGKLLVEKAMEGSLTKTASFTAPANGVYIVKAITESEEFTQKILAQ